MSVTEKERRMKRMIENAIEKYKTKCRKQKEKTDKNLFWKKNGEKGNKENDDIGREEKRKREKE